MSEFNGVFVNVNRTRKVECCLEKINIDRCIFCVCCYINSYFFFLCVAMNMYISPSITFYSTEYFCKVVVYESYINAVGFAFNIKRVVWYEVVAPENGCGVVVVGYNSTIKTETRSRVVEIAGSNSSTKVRTIEEEVFGNDVGIDFW